MLVYCVLYESRYLNFGNTECLLAEEREQGLAELEEFYFSKKGDESPPIDHIFHEVLCRLTKVPNWDRV
jgi:hypothetical protein